VSGGAEMRTTGIKTARAGTGAELLFTWSNSASKSRSRWFGWFGIGTLLVVVSRIGVRACEQEEQDGGEPRQTVSVLQRRCSCSVD
jgi:hypothetical protein